MEKCCTSDPNEFWQYIYKLGPKKKRRDIPWEVTINGECVFDRNQILKKWKEDFENLYRVNDKGFDAQFKLETIVESHRIRNLHENSEDYILNGNITLDKVRKAVYAGKNNKAVGWDTIASELLRNENVVIRLLHCLFNVCFKNGIIPDVWRKVIIHPILKEAGKCTEPLKYRGLALQSCVFKASCHVLNVRLSKHLESSDILEDEQNGFRSKRSCQRHIFSLMVLVRNCIKTTKDGTFTALIHFRKAFDCVDGDLIICNLVSVEFKDP